ncbi:ATP-binding cassette domain-containing protein [Lactobacillus johnsonii]|uniref:ABC transporter ATP-binding protein n=2 Tax=Lactobacillus johnsonii TaxID=33959 RepID=UPI003D670876
MKKMAFIELKNCSKKYGSGSTVVWANKNISFDIKQGELVIILGSSGAGKSTLLNILGGMEYVTEGEVIINGNNIAKYTAKELTKYRRNEIGFVFQFYNLIPNLTKNISFDIKQGELVIILGSSGAGKSTLLNILGGMEYVTEGEVIINGNNIAKYTAKELTKYRRNEIGFVFQFYNLIPNLTAKENVELANELVANPIDAEVALKEVGLEKRINNFPSQLSGGEQQRVAIARAIAKNPSLLLCDEPTGALDYQTGKKVLKILQDRSLKKNSTVVIVTHNAALAPIADKVIRIQDGKVKQIENNSSPQDIAQIEW